MIEHSEGRYDEVHNRPRVEGWIYGVNKCSQRFLLKGNGSLVRHTVPDDVTNEEKEGTMSRYMR